MNGKRVLLVGLDPAVVDFTHFPHLNQEKLTAALAAEVARLIAEGYDAHTCWTDTGATAEAMLTASLSGQPFDCVLIGAGVRTGPPHFLLFEKMINIIHRLAPAAMICFNTGPSDSVAAVQRWV